MSYIRKQRGKTQKIFLLDCKDVDTFIKSYEVVGTTKNVYTVTIKNMPECTCPDYIVRHNRCKHIYFILIRIMKVDENDMDENKFTDDQLLDMFITIPDVAKNIIASKHDKKKYEKYKIKGSMKVEQRSLDDNDCPICLDEINDKDGDENNIVYCQYTCGINIHTECFKKWCDIKGVNGVECPYCRSKWFLDESPYISLA